MALYLEGITPQELKELFKEAVKEEIQVVLNQQREISTESNNKLLTRKETAQRLGVSLVTLHDWCLKGIIESHRINTRIRFKQEDIEKVLSNPRGLKFRTNKA